MHIISIARNIAALLTTLVACCCAFADAVHETSNLPNSEVQIETICSDRNPVAQKCVVKLKKRQQNLVLIRYPFPPISVESNFGTFSIIFPCGTGCSATYFYNGKFGLSRPFPLVIAKNTKSNLILNISKNSLYVYRMFEPKTGSSIPTARIDLGLNPNSDITQSVSAASARGNGFIIQYLDDAGFPEEYIWKN
jgi:hypothetical protein